MARIKRARLSDLFAQLRATAAATGTDRALTLGRGARLAVRVRDGMTIVSLARPRVPLGSTEETTFRVNCQFPPDAVRDPATGQRTVRYQGETWYRVVFRWPTETTRSTS